MTYIHPWDALDMAHMHDLIHSYWLICHYSIACACYDMIKWPIWPHVLNIIASPFFRNIQIPKDYPTLTTTIILLVFKQYQLHSLPVCLTIISR